MDTTQRLFDALCDAGLDKHEAVEQVRAFLFGLIMHTNDPAGYLDAVIKDYQAQLDSMSNGIH